MPHGADLLRCLERVRSAQNTEESTPCTLSTKIEPDSRGTSPAMTRSCEFSDFESQTAATAIVIAVTARQKPAFLRRDAPEFCSKSRFWKSEGAGNDVRLFRAPEFSREPPDRFGLDRVRYRTGFGMIAFAAFTRQ